MRIESKELPSEIYLQSLSEDGLIYNSTNEIQEHEVEQSYRVIPNAIYVPNVYSDNMLIVSETKSLIVWNNKRKQLETLDITEYLSHNFNKHQRSELYFIHSPLHKHLPYATEFTINGKKLSITLKVGVLLGVLLSIVEGHGNKYLFLGNEDPYKEISIILDVIKDNNMPFYKSIVKGLKILEENNIEIKELLDIFIEKQYPYIVLNQKVLLNTGLHFISGILDGIYFFNSPYQKFMKKPINMATKSFRFLLNTLSASYYENDLDEIYVRFPSELKIRSFLNMPISSKMFSKRYIFKDNDIVHYDDLENDYKLFKSTQLDEYKPLPRKITKDMRFEDLVNAGYLFIYPLEYIKFQKSYEKTLYDFSMKNKRSDNFLLPNLTLLKNSDGDLLNCFALETKEANEEAEKTFSPKAHGFWLKEVDGTVDNTISMDYLAGLYAATK